MSQEGDMKSYKVFPLVKMLAMHKGVPMSI